MIIGFISLAAKYGSLNVGVSFNLLAGPYECRSYRDGGVISKNQNKMAVVYYI